MNDRPLTQPVALRVQPSAGIAIAVFFAYVALIAVVWTITGLDYDTISDSTGNAVKGIVIPVGLGALLLAGITTYLGWWRPALFEQSRAGRSWMMVIPAMLTLGGILNFTVVDWGEVTTGAMIVLAVGCLFVGFSEELLNRGLAIVGARGSFSDEKWVVLFSCAMFGLLHVLNVFYGAAVGATIQQVIFAALAGLSYYVVRRITGTLIVTMGLHALWDCSLFTADFSGVDPSAPANLLFIGAIVISFVALLLILREGRRALT